MYIPEKKTWQEPKPRYQEWRNKIRDTYTRCETCDGTGEVHSHNPRCWDCSGCGNLLITVEEYNKINPTTK